MSAGVKDSYWSSRSNQQLYKCKNPPLSLLCRWCCLRMCMCGCVFSEWGPSEQHPPPPLAAGCATGRRDAWGWPACPTSGAAPHPRRRSRSSIFRWGRCCPACRSRTRWSAPGLSVRGEDTEQDTVAPALLHVCKLYYGNYTKRYRTTKQQVKFSSLALRWTYMN